MLDKLKEVEARYEELSRQLVLPEVISDRNKYREFSKEHSDLQPIIECYRKWQKVSSDFEQSKEVFEEAEDPEMRKMAQLEYEELKEKEAELDRELMILLLPKDPNDQKNVMLEIRAGAGGDEAALFAQELFEAYTRYAENRRWKVEIMSISYGSVGGYKEVIGLIRGDGAYSALKYESGVHRVQRVPETETQGRVHTSTVTVAMLPEAEEVDIKIEDKDLRIDVFRAGGPGGQSVNTTDSAVRVTHMPSGLVVSCQDEKSQLKNKNKALAVLRARLLDKKQAEQDKEMSDNRRSQIGSGDRSERIRTYNFPQGRVTDHRIGLTLYQIDSVMIGELDQLIVPLTTHYQAESLKGQAEK